MITTAEMKRRAANVHKPPQGYRPNAPEFKRLYHYDVPIPPYDKQKKQLAKQNLPRILLEAGLPPYEYELLVEFNEICQRSVDLPYEEAVPIFRDAFVKCGVPIKSVPLDLPTEKYVGNRGGKKGGETIVDFMRRVWGPHIEAGAITRPELRRHDPKADEAITNWRRHSEWPIDLDIPSRTDLTERRAKGSISQEIAQIQRAQRALEERRNYAQRR